MCVPIVEEKANHPLTTSTRLSDFGWKYHITWKHRGALEEGVKKTR